MYISKNKHANYNNKLQKKKIFFGCKEELQETMTTNQRATVTIIMAALGHKHILYDDYYYNDKNKNITIKSKYCNC